MSTMTTEDGTTIYYKDWGKGPVVTFSHGWPLNSDIWDGQMLFFAEHGYRVVAHDRRGHGRSSQAWSGNDMDGYADDPAGLRTPISSTATCSRSPSKANGAWRDRQRRDSGIYGTIRPRLCSISAPVIEDAEEVFENWVVSIVRNPRRSS